MKRLKFSVAAIVFTLLVAIIAACVGPAQESEFVLISTGTESTLRQEGPRIYPLASSITQEYYLTNPQNIFRTVTFWIRPTASNEAIDVTDIVLTIGASKYNPVGLRIGEGLWEYIFTSGTIKLEFISENQKQVTVHCNARYDSNNSYGIKLKNSDGSMSYSGKVTSTMDDPSITLAYIVKQESINNSNSRLKLPGSQSIEIR